MTVISEVNYTQPVGHKKRNLWVRKKGYRIANKFLSVHNSGMNSQAGSCRSPQTNFVKTCFPVDRNMLQFASCRAVSRALFSARCMIRVSSYGVQSVLI